MPLDKSAIAACPVINSNSNSDQHIDTCGAHQLDVIGLSGTTLDRNDHDVPSAWLYGQDHLWAARDLVSSGLTGQTGVSDREFLYHVYSLFATMEWRRDRSQVIFAQWNSSLIS